MEKQIHPIQSLNQSPDLPAAEICTGMKKVPVLPNRHVQSIGIQYSRNTRRQFKTMNMNKPNIIEQLA